jgi:bacteriorhodopsin
MGEWATPTVMEKPFSDIAKIVPEPVEIHHPDQRSERRVLSIIPRGSYMMWGWSFLGLLGAVVFLVRVPRSCAEVPGCKDSMNDPGHDVGIGVSPQSRLAAIAVLLGKEVGCLVLAIRERWDGTSLATSGQDPVLPLALMCAVLAVLGATEVGFMLGHVWAHAVPPLVGESWRPVWFLRYCEWFINVPLLLCLTGYCALGRPFSEVVPPILVTEGYMYAAWMALVSNVYGLRIFLVILSFAGYAQATFKMFSWCHAFWHNSPSDMPRRILRMAVTIGLAIVFGMYGVLYLASLFGWISFKLESEIYAIFGFNTKLVATLTLASLRSSERRFATYINLHTTDFIPLLRSSFDQVVLCRIDECHRCVLPKVHGPDMAALSNVVGRPIKGMVFSDLISTEAGREQFKQHLSDTLARDLAEHSFRTLGLIDPEARILRSPEKAKLLTYDLCCSADSTTLATTHVCIYLSTATAPSGASRHVILALRRDQH